MQSHTPPSNLHGIVTNVATKLMGATSSNASTVSTEALAELVSYLDVDVSFLRHNDHKIRATVLVAEWPVRPYIPDPDPLHTIYFADADPIFAMAENAKEPVIVRPQAQGEDYRQRIAEAGGAPMISLATVPLLSGDVTTGVLGFVKFGDREWGEDEINALTVVATMFAQVQARTNIEEQLTYHAAHDDLTGLPNRRTLLAHLDDRLAAHRPGPVPVLLLSLGRLKSINDYLGHVAGDQFIQGFAAELRMAMDGLGLVARIGGDEFVAVPSETMDLAETRRLAENLTARLTEYVTIAGEVINRIVSIGVATGSPGRDSPSDLLRRADEALVSAKAARVDRIGVFSREMLARREIRADMELHLRHAIETDALTVEYLPEVDMPTGKVLAVEALVRWQHPTRGLLLPDLFIPVAESLNLTGELGEWVLNAACADMARWRANGVGFDTMLRINVSPVQLVATGLVDTIAGTLEKFGLEGTALGVEITESTLINDLISTRATLCGLTEIGIDIAIDDFGTGFSGMEMVRTLPVSTLKIDRGFVREIDTSADDLAIVRALIGLARALDLTVVAEGVETDGAARSLLREGCSRAQGFLFCRPLPAAATEQLLAQGSVATTVAT
ncbi:putative bifunctional diguanylate cyclase/phosphodiesterase [Mycobacterium bourgelatii]|uniref:Bifunctional diguanylate cyclase/phosphodiesterase n=1 Tax=Mycobacterium bourgelatii TaxID=1273442 RepID=A0A7I9YLQ4_MYCBU|nr:bifunctional diguanylate cyclase/phosphodiesterase [Mycobacterium bourgelatii]GFG89569.1 bifunctional diguanylate cyclase/phosphodiesterase [Mycobacterium bourgelatii]